MNGFERKTIVAFTKRLKEYYNVKTDKELAIKLDLSHNTINMWKKRGTINLFIIINKCPTLSLDWLLHGVGLPNIYEFEVIDNSDEENEMTLSEYIQLGKSIAKREGLKVTFSI
jgi:hypothetical protein